MTVYLGDAGLVAIQRVGEPVPFELEAEDINVTARRMSIEFGGPPPFISGDRVDITRTDGSATDYLVLIDGVDDERSVTRFVHVDEVGGIRFYETFFQAINGGLSNALPLETTTGAQQILMDVSNDSYRCVAQIREWQITTTRENVDLTQLGDEFRQSYDQGLISGQGEIDAFWDFRNDLCDPVCDQDAELAQYFANLVIRFKEGAKFQSHLFIKDDSPGVWYEADCIVTNVAMSFAPGQTIVTRVSFVTTGEVRLRIGTVPSYLLITETLRADSRVELENQTGDIQLETDLD